MNAGIFLRKRKIPTHTKTGNLIFLGILFITAQSVSGMVTNKTYYTVKPYHYLIIKKN